VADLKTRIRLNASELANLRARNSSRRKPVTRAQRAIEWIETHARIPEGPHVGKPVNLRPWQKRELKRIYDNPHGCRRAIISWGRKNAKTTLAAFILLLHLCGPEAKPNGQLFSAAQSREQAAITFGLAAKIVRLSPTLNEHVAVRDTAKQLYCAELGTLYRALSAEVSTAFGLSPVLVIHDELGQVRGPRSDLYDALETSTGAQAEPLSIVISTQAPSDGDLLSVLIDDALTGADPRVICSLHTADPALDPFSLQAIKQANPALGDFQNKAEVLAMAADAKRLPSKEASYRNLILNQRVEAKAPFIAKAAWQACGDPVLDTFEGLTVFGGLDLSATTDLTGLVLVAHHDGRWHVKPTAWLPEAGLRERSRLDRVPYDVWAQQGFLNTTPGKSIEYAWVAHRLRQLFDTLSIAKIGFDDWNWKHFKPWLVEAGFTEAELERHFVPFRQGFKTMSPALRDVEGLILNGKIAHANHPVLTMCAANAVVATDPAGNRKLAKDKSTGRIDLMVAMTMALAMALAEPLPVIQPAARVSDMAIIW